MRDCRKEEDTTEHVLDCEVELRKENTLLEVVT